MLGGLTFVWCFYIVCSNRRIALKEKRLWCVLIDQIFMRIIVLLYAVSFQFECRIHIITRNSFYDMVLFAPWLVKSQLTILRHSGGAFPFSLNPLTKELAHFGSSLSLGGILYTLLRRFHFAATLLLPVMISWCALYSCICCLNLIPSFPSCTPFSSSPSHEHS